MEFQKKLKIRRNTAIVYLILGIALIFCGCWIENEFLSPLGAMFLCIGSARLAQLRRITRSEESLKQREIAETDERNVMLWTQARSLACSLYIFAACIAVIVLHLAGMKEIAQCISWCVLGFVLIYWGCYWWVSRKY